MTSSDGLSVREVFGRGIYDARLDLGHGEKGMGTMGRRPAIALAFAALVLGACGGEAESSKSSENELVEWGSAEFDRRLAFSFGEAYGQSQPGHVDEFDCSPSDDEPNYFCWADSRPSGGGVENYNVVQGAFENGRRICWTAIHPLTRAELRGCFNARADQEGGHVVVDGSEDEAAADPETQDDGLDAGGDENAPSEEMAAPDPTSTPRPRLHPDNITGEEWPSLSASEQTKVVQIYLEERPSEDCENRSVDALKRVVDGVPRNRAYDSVGGILLSHCLSG